MDRFSFCNHERTAPLLSNSVSKQDNFSLGSKDSTEEFYCQWAKVADILEFLDSSQGMDDKNAIIRAGAVIDAMYCSFIDTLQNEDENRYTPPYLTHTCIYVLMESRDRWKSLIKKQVLPHFKSCSLLNSDTFEYEINTLRNTLIYDQLEGKLSSRFKRVEIFFRGIHQASEVGFWIQRQLLKVFNSTDCSAKKAQILHTMARMADRLGDHVLCLKNLDIAAYAEYRPALTGTSGAGSRQLKYLQSELRPLIAKLYTHMETDSNHNYEAAPVEKMKHLLASPEANTELYNLLIAAHDLETSYLRFWNQHALLAASTIGYGNIGTQDLAVSSLFERVENRMKHSIILQAVGQLGLESVEQHPELVTVDENGNKVGLAIAERRRACQ